MMSGLQDELVPPEHMKTLWGIVTDEAAKEEVEEADEELKQERERKEEMERKKAVGRKWRKVRKGCKWWMEFADGMHSTSDRTYWP